MKNVFIPLLTICFFLSSSLLAQFELGVSGGINIASFNVEDEKDEVTSRTLWNIGAVVEYKLNNQFSIKAEPMYLKKGGILEESDNNAELKFDQSYLEVPIMLKFSIGEKNKVFLITGPTVGITLSSELEADLEGITFSADLKDLTESLDFGLGVGGGFSFAIYPGTLFFQGKYTFGLTNLAKDGTFTAKAGHLALDAELDEEESEYKSRGVQLSIGFTIPI